VQIPCTYPTLVTERFCNPQNVRLPLQLPEICFWWPA